MISIPLLIIIVVMIIAVILTIRNNKRRNMIEQTHNENVSTNKLDRVGYVFNIVLSIIYIPISFFSWLLFMASEATIGATNQVFIAMINIFCCITLVIPLLCFLGILLSVRFRRKGYSVWSFVIQFLPLILFGMNLLLLFIAESLPAAI